MKELWTCANMRLVQCTVVGDVHLRAGVLEDLQHAGAGDVPDVGAELLPVQNHQVLQAVGPRPRQLFVVCGREEATWRHSC